MEKDRTEMHDLASQRPELVSKMARQYDTWAGERGVVPFGSWRNNQKKSSRRPARRPPST